MIENKKITIYELLPLLKPGWVAMDKNGKWWWYEVKPYVRNDCQWRNSAYLKDDADLSTSFNIAPFDGDWKDSLMEVK